MLSKISWSVFGVFAPAVLTFLVTPVLVRALGEQTFGLYLLLITIGMLFELSDLGLGEATIRYVAHYHARQDRDGVERVFAATLAVQFVFGALFACVIGVCSGQLLSWLTATKSSPDEGSSALAIMCMGYGVSAFGGTHFALLTAFQRFDVISRFRTFVAILHSVSLVAAVQLGGGVTVLAALFVGKNVVEATGAVALARRVCPGLPVFPRVSRTGLSEVFSYGLYASAMRVLTMLSNHADRFVLSAFLGLRELSYLAVPRTVLDKGGGLLNGAAAVLFPAFSTSPDKPLQRRLFLFSTWGLTVLSVAGYGASAVVMHDFLRLWISKEFADASAEAAAWICTGLAIRGGYAAYFQYLKGTGEIRLLTKVQTGMSALSLAVVVILVQHFGLMGVAYRVLFLAGLGWPVLALVWTRFLQGKARDLAWVVVPPFAVGLAVAWAASFPLRALTPPDWIGLAATWCGIATAIVLLSTGLDVILRQRQGAAFWLVNRILLVAGRRLRWAYSA